MKKVIEIKDLKIGDLVAYDGDSGFCTPGIGRVKGIKMKYDEDSGEKFKVIIIDGGWEFDERTRRPLGPPYAYFILPTEQ